MLTSMKFLALVVGLALIAIGTASTGLVVGLALEAVTMEQVKELIQAGADTVQYWLGGLGTALATGTAWITVPRILVATRNWFIQAVARALLESKKS